MNADFKPLRRKIGVATVVLGCLSMVGWMRSVRTIDVFQLRVTPKMTYLFRSVDSSLVWQSLTDTKQPQTYLVGACLINTKKHRVSSHQTPSDGNLGNCFQRNLVFRSLPGGSDQFEYSNCEIRAWVAPYWSIVMLLILISACLLWSKPYPKVSASNPDN